MIRLGLTGSIATGKSTTAQFFRDAGVPVLDADAAVHAIYADEGVGPVGQLIPFAIVDGVVDRGALKAALANDDTLLPKLEAIVHPLVQAREAQAAAMAEAEGNTLMVFDIPLLFETGGDKRMDKTAVAHCTPETQLERLMDRTGMTEETAKMLMARQMPQDEKKARADYLISTEQGLDHAREAVEAIITELRA